MTIRIWNSFSCNNSSSYRLVARFADATTARETADELAAFFATHAREVDAVFETGDVPEDAPPAARALASKYGFTWDRVVMWGDDVQEGDEPAVASEGEVLVVFHSYCNGFGDVSTYLKNRGGTVEPEWPRAPSVSILFARKKRKALDAELDAMFAQVDDHRRYVEPFRTPWKTERESYGDAAFFRDANTVGLYFPIEPTDLPAIKAWLGSHGIERPSIRLCEDADEAKFVAIAAARCASCNQPLAYLTPRIHDIDHEQLVCHACGGLYDMSTFMTKPS